MGQMKMQRFLILIHSLFSKVKSLYIIINIFEILILLINNTKITERRIVYRVSKKIATFCLFFLFFFHFK